MKAHYQALRKEKKDDPNKANLDGYLKVFGSLTLAVKGMAFATVEDGEDDKADPDNLPEDDLAAMDSTDDKDLVLLRRKAVWAIANLGNNLGRLAKLSEERRAEIISALESEVAGSSGERKQWAETTLDYLKALQEGRQPSSHGVVAALAAAAGEDDDNSDRFLRELVAHALNFWHGDDSEEKQIETTLVQLSRDEDRGKVIEIEEND